jgi:hypothetical protein
MLAKDSLDIFQYPFKCIEDIEKNGKEALELLAQRHVFLVVLRIFKSSHQNDSVCAIPRFSKFTGSDNNASSEKLSSVALELVIRWHEKKIQVGNLPATYCAPDLTVVQ